MLTTFAPEVLVPAEEYLQSERTAELRNEYVHGEIYPMPGEKKKANLLANTLLMLLWPLLKKQHQEAFTQSVKVVVENGNIYRYPDLVVSAKTDSSDPYLIFEPSILVEVASKKSYYIDRFEKLAEYRSIPSVQCYLIVHQERMAVEAFFRKADGSWEEMLFTNEKDEIKLPVVGLLFTLGQLYEDVDLSPTASDDDE
ncbi:MAG: Uma2 family endonuclease [Saprospiraceae bacterium]